MNGQGPSGEDPGRRVLVIEDEPRLRSMLTRVICEMDFEVAAFGTAEEGLEHLESHLVDIALCDLSLPGMDGLEMFAHVRRRWPEVQLVMLTGHGNLDAAKRAIHLDVVDFLTKPCPLADIESALDRALRRRRHGILMRGDAGPGPAEASEADDVDPGFSRLEDVEREHILNVLAKHDGNRRETAEELGISVRTLYYRLDSYEKQGWIRRDERA